MKKILLISAVFLIGCSSAELDFPDEQNPIVVEGWITDEIKEHHVKISRTVGFSDSRQEEPITDATVTIEPNIGPPIILNHQGSGVYSTPEFSGTVARSYKVNIQLGDGAMIESDFQRLNQVPPIESINFDSFVRQNPETGLDEDIYYPVVTFSDPPTAENFYRYKGFRNDIELIRPEELVLLSDVFFNGESGFDDNIPQLEYAVGDEIRVELHSLSASAFDFMELLRQQTTSLGSSSGTSPAALIGNLRYTNGEGTVLGFFGASSVDEASIMVQEF